MSTVPLAKVKISVKLRAVMLFLDSSRTTFLTKFDMLYAFQLTCAFGGIHPGWVDHASPIEAVTSRMDVLIVVAHIFS